MLIEELHLQGIDTIFSNTDGITCLVDINKEEIFTQVYKDFETRFGFEIETEVFKKMFVRDVNNLLILKYDNSIKARGVYQSNSYIEKYGEFNVSGSFIHPIVPIAACNYLLYNKPILDTLMNHTDIYDFCICKKTGKQFKNILLNTILNEREILQQSVRFYISKSNNKLFKEKLILKKNKLSKHDIKMKDGSIIYQGRLFDEPDTNESISSTDFVVGKNITIFNDYVESDNYNIDYEYYLDEANKLINIFNE